MKEFDVFKDYENTRLVHYSELDSHLGESVCWDDLPNTEIEGTPISIRRKDDGKLYVNTVPDTHVLTIGATRCGKTQSFVIPYGSFLATRKNKCSMVFSDPKLEIFDSLSPTLAEQGYKIILLNFIDSQISDRWNPFTPIFDLYQDYLKVEETVTAERDGDGYYNVFRGKKYVDHRRLEYAINAEKKSILYEVQSRVEELATVMCPPTNDRDASWMNGARSIFKGLIFAMLEDSVPSDKYTVITRETFSLSTLLDIYDRIGRADNDFTNAFFDSRDKNTSIAFRLVQRYMFIKAEVTKDGYMSSLATAMTKINDGAIRQITCANTFSFSDFDDGNQPCAIFLAMKDETKLYYDIIGLFLSDLYKSLINMTRKNGNKPRKTPFYFVLDEFGNMPKFNDFDSVISACGGRNIWFWLVIQSYAQLENVYGENNAKIIKDNLNMHIFLGTNNPETKKEFSKECGEHTIYSVMSAVNGEGEHMAQYQKETIPIIPVSTLSHLEIGEGIITRMNADVTWSRLERYYTCPELSRDNKPPYEYTNDFMLGDPRYDYVPPKLSDGDD